jgi:hypothetical protein
MIRRRWPIESFQFHSGWRQAKEAHATVHRAQRRIHARIAIHPAEIGYVIVQFQVFILQHLQHHVQGLIKQSVLDRVVVVLQEGAYQLVRFFKLLQGEMNEQLQLENAQLPPVRILIKVDANQRGDVGS